MKFNGIKCSSEEAKLEITFLTPYLIKIESVYYIRLT